MVLTGDDITLPLLLQAATVRSHVAERLIWHAHEGTEVIFLLVGGTAYEFPGNRTLPLPGGHFLVVPGGTQHRGLNNVRMPSKLVGLTFNLRQRGGCPIVPFTRGELDWMKACFAESGGGVYPFGPALKEILPHLEAGIAAWGPKVDLAHKASLRTLICASILEAAREIARRPVERPNEIVAGAVTYLRARFDEPLHVPALAKHLGLSRTRVFDLFTAETGMTPHDYLLRLRLEKATELLQNTRQSITEIALATGFGSGQHFSRVFRRYRGETPCRCRGALQAGCAA